MSDSYLKLNIVRHSYSCLKGERLEDSQLLKECVFLQAIALLTHLVHVSVVRQISVIDEPIAAVDSFLAPSGQQVEQCRFT